MNTSLPPMSATGGGRSSLGSPSRWLPSIVHYLIIDLEARAVIHDKRGEAGVVETRFAELGSLRLDPPGLEFAVADVFGGMITDQAPIESGSERCKQASSRDATAPGTANITMFFSQMVRSPSDQPTPC
jgi:hypothetical protein